MLGLLGASGAGLAIAPALRVLTWPLLAVNAALLARAWFLATRGHFATPTLRKAPWVLVLSTALSLGLWAARFAGFLGGVPL